MKRAVISSAVKRIAVLRKNGPFILFFLAAAIGTVFGSLSSRSADAGMLKRLDLIFLTNLELRSSQGILSLFISSFSSVTVFMLAAFLLGLSLWGGALCILIPFFKGYGYGLTAGFVCAAYGMRGFFYNLLVILPGMFISCAVVSMAALHSFKKSLSSVMLLVRSPVKDDPRAQLSSYTFTMLRLMLLCAVSSLTDVLCSISFSWLFRF